VTTDPVPAGDPNEFLWEIAARDEVAFGKWVSGAESPIRASLRSFALHLDVEAIVQETLLRIWQVAPRLVAEGRRNGLLPLAITIGQNLALSDLRRRKVEEATIKRIEGETPPEPRPALSDPWLRECIKECLRRLPRQPRRALLARIGDAGSAVDSVLAQGLGMRLNTFLQNITRARKLVAECLRRHRVDLARELA
jgi:RNA polymerase sigma-70 factor (ECF subfamily)